MIAKTTLGKSPMAMLKAESQQLARGVAPTGHGVAPAMGTGEGAGCTAEESWAFPPCLCYAPKWNDPGNGAW